MAVRRAGRRDFVHLLLAAPALACGRPQDAPASTDPPAKAPSDPAPEDPPGASAPAPTPTDLDEQLAALRQQFAGRGFTILAEPPFAVVGDGEPERVQGYAERVVRWAVRHLEALYFEQPPSPIVTVYLFETASSYERNAYDLSGEAPDTPYGYYSRSDNALVMNISTGGGTLVHEIVHPYMETNFSSCPTWFDEGLASLYEQSAEIDGKMKGMTNWRLAGLQDALRAKQVPSFLHMCSSGLEFYTKDPHGTNYAQARYLCYWLQQRGQLRNFYRDFRAKVGIDPTGYDTLVRFVGGDMEAFEARWETFVLGLSYPEAEYRRGR